MAALLYRDAAVPSVLPVWASVSHEATNELCLLGPRFSAQQLCIIWTLYRAEKCHITLLLFHTHNQGIQYIPRPQDWSSQGPES